METRSEGPGAVLVVLRRLATRTDVMLVPAGPDGAPLPCAAPQGQASQRELVEELIRKSGIGVVDRLYGSTLSVPGADGTLGVFVAFFGEGSSGTPLEGAWRDLRGASQGLTPVWSAALSTVREQFVARAPDEALRIR